jgi:hypothetical protein
MLHDRKIARSALSCAWRGAAAPGRTSRPGRQPPPVEGQAEVALMTYCRARRSLSGPTASSVDMTQ